MDGIGVTVGQSGQGATKVGDPGVSPATPARRPGTSIRPLGVLAYAVYRLPRLTQPLTVALVGAGVLVAVVTRAR